MTQKSRQPVPMPAGQGRPTAPMPVGQGRGAAPMPAQPGSAGPLQVGANIAPDGQSFEHDGQRYLLTLSPDAGAACEGCGAQQRELNYARFRRVIGALIVDFVKDYAGYYCTSCRRTLFLKQTGQTLLLGWWGFAALVFRNPAAIVTNIAWMLGKPLMRQRDKERMLKVASSK